MASAWKTVPTADELDHLPEGLPISGEASLGEVLFQRKRKMPSLTNDMAYFVPKIIGVTNHVPGKQAATPDNTKH